MNGHRAPFSYGYSFQYLLRSRTLFFGGKVETPCHLFSEPVKPHETRLFSPLLRNFTAHFPHTLGGLFAGNAPPAVRAVFDIVGAGREKCAAYRTPPFVLALVKLGIKQLVGGKYSITKPFAKQGVGNHLRAYARLPVVQ